METGDTVVKDGEPEVKEKKESRKCRREKKNEGKFDWDAEVQVALEDSLRPNMVSRIWLDGLALQSQAKS